ncbi:MAG: PepSY domain-containing protein [Candidatus Izemoplasmataceae bacterium]
MKHKDVEQKIYEEFNQKKPEIFQSILEQCPKMNEAKVRNSIWDRMRVLFHRRSFTYSFTAIVVFAVLFFAVIGVGPNQNPSVYSVVAIDVNPSLVLELDEEDKVINVIKNNEDANIIIGDMDLIGVDSDVAINALIGSMVANGYISNFTNSILLSVRSEDDLHKDEIINKLTAIINNILSGSSINGSVITQTLNVEQDAEDLAERLDISEAKAELVLRIIQIDSRMIVDDLARLSINDLNLLLEAKNYVLDDVKHTGNASDLEIISQATIYENIRTYLNLEESDVVEYDLELEQEDGLMVYEVEIVTIAFEYTVIVDAKQGTILKTTSEAIDDAEDPSDDYDDPIYDNILSEEEILELVLQELGLTQSLVQDLDFDLDEENGIAFYDIAFVYNGQEYELSVNAETGFIFSNSNDEDGYEYDDEEDEEEYDNEEESDSLGEDSIVDEEVLVEDTKIDEEALVEDTEIDEEVLVDDTEIDEEVLAEDVEMDEDAEFPENALTVEEISILLEEELEIDLSLTVDLEFNQEIESGVPYYQVGFYYDDQEYEIEVNALSGEIYINSQE